MFQTAKTMFTVMLFGKSKSMPKLSDFKEQIDINNDAWNLVKDGSTITCRIYSI